jgi:hypothetical protein
MYMTKSIVTVACHFNHKKQTKPNIYKNQQNKMFVFGHSSSEIDKAKKGIRQLAENKKKKKKSKNIMDIKEEVEAEAQAKKGLKEGDHIRQLDMLIRDTVEKDTDEVDEINDPMDNIVLGSVRTVHLFEESRNVTVTFRIDRRKSDLPTEQGYGIITFGACIYPTKKHVVSNNNNNDNNHQPAVIASNIITPIDITTMTITEEPPQSSVDLKTTVNVQEGCHRASKKIRQRGLATATAHFNMVPHVFVCYWVKTNGQIILPLDIPKMLEHVPTCEMNMVAISTRLCSWIHVCGVRRDFYPQMDDLGDICMFSQLLQVKTSKKKEKNDDVEWENVVQKMALIYRAQAGSKENAWIC